MRRQLIPQIALPRRLGVDGLLAQVQHFADERIDLGLLADDDLVEFVEQVFGEAGFDLEFGQALGGVLKCVGQRLRGAWGLGHYGLEWK